MINLLEADHNITVGNCNYNQPQLRVEPVLRQFERFGTSTAPKP